MRLVDADESGWYVNKRGCEMMEEMPTIDAIPIEWLLNYAKEKAEAERWSEIADFTLSVINGMVKAWRENEHEHRFDKRRKAFGN